MNPELESLVLAYNALLEARKQDREQAYETLLERTLDRHPGLSRESLHTAVVFAHRKWARKQESKPPHIPPIA